MDKEVLVVVIATLVSPVFLKLVEWVFSSASATNRKVQERLDGLAKRVDELKSANTELSMKVVVQEQKIKDQAATIVELQRQNHEKDEKIKELETQMQSLEARKGKR